MCLQLNPFLPSKEGDPDKKNTVISQIIMDINDAVCVHFLHIRHVTYEKCSPNNKLGHISASSSTNCFFFKYQHL